QTLPLVSTGSRGFSSSSRRKMMSAEEVLVPDDRAFSRFRGECQSEQGWSLTYSRTSICVWIQVLQEEKSLHRIKCRMLCKDIPAETMYDVLHDIEYRRKWDANVIETFDIGKLTVNADVGYYSWKCPKPLKNRDVITLRSWLPMGNDYIIMNYSVKHAKYPPKKDLVRAVSIQTGYLIQHTGPISCTLTYLAQVDPRGSLPKWVVNKSSQFLAPKVSKVCTGSLHPYTRLFLHSFTLLSGGYLFCSSLSTFDAGNPALVIKVSGQFK
uniref:START domain-containing protein 10 n=1 Tax=Sinocyclocheilus anshuiensis TaxID=1608454 RepID=A0A671MD03_9TELE